MRLDKFLSETNTLTRSEAKAAIKKGQVCVNGSVNKDPGANISETTDEIRFQNRVIEYRKFLYFVLNKPAGYVVSENEEDGEPVSKLLPEEYKSRLKPVGRLDKNTSGLLLFTNDGETAHILLSPKNHVEKTYLVKCEKNVSDEDIRRLSEGVNLGDGEISLPAKAKRGEDETELYLTIHEGKYHQVKRMMVATCNKVIFLKRISFGGLALENLSIEEGEGRLLNSEETDILLAKGIK